MLCACPWCSKEIQEGCYSLMGQGTCKEHDFESIMDKISPKNKENSPSELAKEDDSKK